MKNKIEISKLLSLVLRHKPETIGIMLDENGWCNVNELLEKLNENGYSLDFETLKIVVDTNSKKRFVIDEIEGKIRANQGHSLNIDLGLEKVSPPDVLYHGTADRFVDSILKSGLLKGERHDVHLSLDLETALNVGKRHGKPVVFIVDSKQMFEDGLEFKVSGNEVWLTDYVPAKYLKI